LSAFVAIDFETADFRGDSACAVGVVRVAGGRVVERTTHLIRPPLYDADAGDFDFHFTYLHGISWDDVAAEPDFGELWGRIARRFEDADFIAAHNARFDRNVLDACCAFYDIPQPRLPMVCTVRLARALWGIRPTRLPDVCRRLGIRLRHHDAGSDALACARIVIAAERLGWKFGS
jgi:DNA polymerase-3 subunit epsilon